jgi:hypothetical protein
MPIDMQATGRFGNHLLTVMRENDIDLRGLSTKVNSTYEHLRKLVKGLAYPSEYMLDQLDEALKGFNRQHAGELRDVDKSQRRLKNFHAITKRNPELDRFEEVWPQLSRTQKDTMFKMLDSLLEGSANERRRRAH